MRPGAQSALAGAVGAAMALGVSELVCGLAGSGPSLVSAVGTEFIDRFAASLKEMAVRLFGTNDKTALVVGIVVVSVALGGLLGWSSRRRLAYGVAGFVAFGAVGLWAYLQTPLGRPATGVAAAVLAVAAGVGTLAVLRPAGHDEVVDGVASGTTMTTAPRAAVADPRVVTSSRRTVLTAVALGGVAVGAAALGRRLRVDGTVEATRRRTTLPQARAARPAPAVQPFTVAGLTPYVTPNTDFYRIDTALSVPDVDVSSWRLKVDGMVERPFTIGYDELLGLDAVEEVVTLQCVSNEVGGDLVGNAVWQGVPLAALLERAGVRPEATQIVGRSVDRWATGFPTSVGTDGRVALVAYAMNGEPLPRRHGFPARLVVAGLYGYVSATKWLQQVELTTWEAFDGYWVPRGWSKEGPMKTASRIDVPRAGARLAPGRTAVAGVAWAPSRGVRAVEVQVDDGGWQPARLGEVASENTWVQWLYEWDASPGDHVLRVRAVDGDGQVQTGEVRRPDPDGATGWHSRRVQVAG